MPALEAVLTDTLPPGVTFVSATDNGIEAGGVVTWELGNLGSGEGGTVHVTVELGAPGIYANSGSMTFRAGVNTLRSSPTRPRPPTASTRRPGAPRPQRPAARPRAGEPVAAAVRRAAAPRPRAHQRPAIPAAV